jgi:hypothetical protein
VEQTILTADYTDGADSLKYSCLYPRYQCNPWLKNLARGIPRGVTRILNGVLGALWVENAIFWLRRQRCGMFDRSLISWLG